MVTKFTSVFTIFIINLLTLNMLAQPVLSYSVSMSEPHTHYYSVEMNLTNVKTDTISVKMAVWTPGSYLVREFSRKVDGFIATDEKGNALPVIKTQKNTWHIEQIGKEGVVNIKYQVYSFELSVRTSFLDSDMGFISPSSMFMYVNGFQQIPSKLTIKPFKGWNQISTALKPVNSANKWVLDIPDYDTLVDSPILIGNHEVIDFIAAGIPHQLAVAGAGNHDIKRMAMDIPPILEAATAIFGEHPCTDYTFLQINTQNMGGGLEHLHSTALMNPRWNFEPESNYQKWLGLVAHEYFHLWNVKRLRPIELGPFNYETENYTRLLWVAEGFTSYYDDLILRRAKVLDAKSYLGILSGNIAGVDSKPGSLVQNLAESSLDAWIKYYRPDENSDNTTVSYYNGGAIVAAMLDLLIRQETKGKKSLDDVMRFLYAEYYKKNNRGFSEQEFISGVEKIAGVPMTDFFKDHVYGTKLFDYNKYLNYAGLQMINNATPQGANLGINTTITNNQLTISKVKRGSCAYKYGLSVNDEILAVNNFRVSTDIELKNAIARYQVGETVVFLVNRAGVVKSISVQLETLMDFSYKIEKLPQATSSQKAIYQDWLGEKF